MDQTQGFRPFQVIAVHYAESIEYKKREKVEGKAYIVLYACSCRLLYLDLVALLGTQEFILSVKKFIARKGTTEKIYSDKSSTFVGAAGWLSSLPRTRSISPGSSTLVVPPGGVENVIWISAECVTTKS